MKSLWTILLASFASFALFGCDSDECTDESDCDEGEYCDHSSDESEDQTEGECVAYEEGDDGGLSGDDDDDDDDDIGGDDDDDDDITCNDACDSMSECTCAKDVVSLCKTKCTSAKAAELAAMDSCEEAISFLGLTSACTAASGAYCTANGVTGVCVTTSKCAEYASTGAESVSGHCDGGSDVQCCINVGCKTVPGYCYNADDADEVAMCEAAGGETVSGQCPGNANFLCCKGDF